MALSKNFVLGTAQIGKNYGLSHNFLFKRKKHIFSIFDYASKKKIKHLDTAFSYGKSEKNIGDYFKKSKNKFKIITKIDSLKSVKKENLKNVISRKIKLSLSKLNIKKIDVLLIHDFNDIKKHKNKLLECFKELQATGLIKEFGVSIYHPKQALFCMKIKLIKHLQLPFNILDQRWLNKKFIKKLKKRSDIKIHVRSIFLRGLLLNKRDFWPSWFHNKDKVISMLEFFVRKFFLKSKVQLCLAYVQYFNWVNFIVLGVDNKRHLQIILENKKNKRLTHSNISHIVKNMGPIINNKKILLPYKWK